MHVRNSFSRNWFSTVSSLWGILMPLSLFWGLSACASPPYPKSDHFDGKKFFNPGRKDEKGFSDFLKWQLTSDRKPWPEWVENKATPQVAKNVSGGEAHVTFVNHATFLLQFESLNVLTDPVFSDRVSPVSWAGPKRVRAPGLAMDQLPKIDVILVSHSHYDHMDIPSLKSLQKKHNPLILLPLGNKKILERNGIKGAVEMDWWQSHEVGGQKITLVPAHHWSSRSPWDRNEALWGGFVIEAGGVKAYFAGDSGYGPIFKELVSKLGVFDVSIIPIGAYEPRWFMKQQHLNPDDAVLAHLDLQSPFTLGAHFGTFQLTDEGIDDPIVELAQALEKHKVSKDLFPAPENGQTFVIRKK